MTRMTLLFSTLLALSATSALAAKQSEPGTESQDASSASKGGETRDWSKIDTDKDGYVEAAEMEAYLQSVWSKNGKASASGEKSEKEK